MGGEATPRYRVLTVDDVEAVPGPASLAWRPLRAELGLRRGNHGRAVELGIGV